MTDQTEKPEHTCEDCGFPVRGITQAKIDKGSMVRDPGEVVCPNCSAHRSRMLKDLTKLPDNLFDIQNMRRAR